MQKKQKIDEKAVDYIRKNKEDLGLRYPGLFLVFQGENILKQCKTNDEALKFTREKGIILFVIWHFDPLPDRVGERVAYDKELAEKERARKLHAKRQRKYYQKNQEKILQKQAEKKEKNRERQRRWYYKNKEATLLKKKQWKLGVIA